MQRNLCRHRKPRMTRTIATRTAVSAGAAAAALLLPAAGASAATTVAGHSPAIAISGENTTAEPPCTGTPLDAMIGPIIGSTCGSGEGGGPGEENEGGNPPPPM